MSVAYKCDHCGKCYDPTENPEGLFLNIRTGFISKGKSFLNHGPLGEPFVEDVGNRDFCKDCTKIILKQINRQEDKKNEKKPKDSNDIVDEFHNAIDDFLKEVGSRGTAILREYIYGDRDGDFIERKGNTKEDSTD